MPEDEAFFDGTIPDPFDSQQSIEDPLHGPTARRQLKTIPPMPMGNGLYYQPGNLYELGTPYVDALNRPVTLIGSARSSREAMRQSLELTEWVTAAGKGEEALLVLETARQRQRLTQNRVTTTYRDTDACVGGKWRRDCETSQLLVGLAFDITFNDLPEQVEHHGPPATETWGVLASPALCSDCELVCVAAVQLRNNAPTGVVRITTVEIPAAD